MGCSCADYFTQSPVYDWHSVDLSGYCSPVSYAHRDPRWGMMGLAMALPALVRFTTPTNAHQSGVKSTQHVDSQTQQPHRLRHIRLEVGSPLESLATDQRQGNGPGSLLTGPFARTKPKVRTAVITRYRIRVVLNKTPAVRFFSNSFGLSKRLSQIRVECSARRPSVGAGEANSAPFITQTSKPTAFLQTPAAARPPEHHPRFIRWP